MFDQLGKGTEMILHSQTLLAARVLQPKASNKAASEHKSRKRKRIQEGGDLSKEQAEDLTAELNVRAQVDEATREGKARTAASKQRKRHCKRYGETRHNSRACEKEIIEVND
ncbi:hypothetical protein COCCADRAFT_31459 [Bipolaris zeicola 26-R-13]|uniref:Uncharacterized protein n=1 Tax=Cochliobolus carbonum (strain 26-R-13) TaxID=930089 RepID=W6XIH1_COCC2|nr:uncharacterized protein COCCADRAFT_31459 [Bipolaris zeicola 26-R-13]EUC26892.1 hypothetical protein COCCADRAFT_31459 [Bipolaris zeicola 26-R-13]